MSIKKTIAVVATALMGAGAAVGAVSAQPGPNGPNNFGLCTAYFAGSDQGRQQKRKAPPFQALEAAAEEAWDGDEDATMDEKVAEWCRNNAPHPSNNGNGNGRR